MQASILKNEVDLNLLLKYPGHIFRLKKEVSCIITGTVLIK